MTMLLACSVCFGQSDSPMAQATNLGVFMMLGVVAVMLASFAGFFIYLARRARLAARGAFDSLDQRAPASAAGAAILRTDPQEGTAQC